LTLFRSDRIFGDSPFFPTAVSKFRYIQNPFPPLLPPYPFQSSRQITQLPLFLLPPNPLPLLSSLGRFGTSLPPLLKNFAFNTQQSAALLPPPLYLPFNRGLVLPVARTPNFPCVAQSRINWSPPGNTPRYFRPLLFAVLSKRWGSANPILVSHNGDHPEINMVGSCAANLFSFLFAQPFYGSRNPTSVKSLPLHAIPPLFRTQWFPTHPVVKCRFLRGFRVRCVGCSKIRIGEV